MSDETYGAAGYTSRGRVAPVQIKFLHPDGGELMFESNRKNGVDYVIIDWSGDGVLGLTTERFAALAELMGQESLLSKFREAA